MTGKGVNLGVELGLELLVTYFFNRNARVLTRVKNSLKKLDKELHVKVKKCVI